MKKIILDISPLNLGKEKVSNGVARVTLETIRAIYRDKNFKLYFYVTQEDNYLLCKQYILLNTEFKDVIFLNDGDTIISKLLLLLLNYYIRILTKLGLSKTIGFVNRLKTKIINNCLESKDIYYSTFFDIPTVLTRLSRIMKFIFVHDLIPVKFPEYFGIPNGSQNHYLYSVFKTLDINTTVITNSENTKRDFLLFRPDFPKEKVKVNYLAASSSFKNNTDNEKLNSVKLKCSIPLESNYFITNSTLEIRKNLDHVIECFFMFLEKYKINNLYLVLTGKKGWNADKIFKALESNTKYREKIILTGFVSDEELAILYSGALCFAYMSLYEGFGLPPLEAMQSGCPVITSNNSSLPEIVGKSGVLLDSNDHKSLVNSFYRFYSDINFRNEFKEKAMEQSKLFSWEKYSKTLITILNSSI